MSTYRNFADKVLLDLKAYADHEGTNMSVLFVLRMVLLTVGFQFVLSRRLGELVYALPLIGRLLRRVVWWMTCLIFSSELAIAADIDGGLYIPHPYGIVVGRCRIGRGVTILQNVTVGKRRSEVDAAPVILDGSLIGAGSAVLGSVTIGPCATVGALSVVVRDVPAGVTVMGAPARAMARPAETLGVQPSGFVDL